MSLVVLLEKVVVLDKIKMILELPRTPVIAIATRIKPEAILAGRAGCSSLNVASEKELEFADELPNMTDSQLRATETSELY